MKRIVCLFLFLLSLLTGTACAKADGSAGRESQAPEISAATRAGGRGETRAGQPDAPEPSATAGPVKETGLEQKRIAIIVGGKHFSATLYDNAAAKTFAGRFPLTLSMSELNGNEKYADLETGLPASPINPGVIQTGDLMLYNGGCLVLFYESFSTSYSYTPLGRVENPQGLAEALGRGSAAVTFQAEELRSFLGGMIHAR